MKKSEIISLSIAAIIVAAAIHGLVYGWIFYVGWKVMKFSAMLLIAFLAIAATFYLANSIHKTFFK